jgi:hypothetical protein
VWGTLLTVTWQWGVDDCHEQSLWGTRQYPITYMPSAHMEPCSWWHSFTHYSWNENRNQKKRKFYKDPAAEELPSRKMPTRKEGRYTLIGCHQQQRVLAAPANQWMPQICQTVHCLYSLLLGSSHLLPGQTILLYAYEKCVYSSLTSLTLPSLLMCHFFQSGVDPKCHSALPYVHVL